MASTSRGVPSAATLGTGGKMTSFQRAGPVVTTAIGTRIASVRRVRIPDSVDVDASRPNSGVQVPRSPACWSISTPTAPPSRRNAVGPLKPFLRLNMRVARLRALLDVGLDVLVAERLVDAAPFVLRQHLAKRRVEFPVAHVAEDHDDALALVERGDGVFDALDRADLVDTGGVEPDGLDGTEQVRAERGEVLARERAISAGVLLAPYAMARFSFTSRRYGTASSQPMNPSACPSR